MHEVLCLIFIPTNLSFLVTDSSGQSKEVKNGPDESIKISAEVLGLLQSMVAAVEEVASKEIQGKGVPSSEVNKNN